MEEALTRAALDHAAALRAQPGCIAAYVMTERETGMQWAFSLFDSEGAFQRAATVTLPVILRHRVESLREGDSTFHLFDVR